MNTRSKLLAIVLVILGISVFIGMVRFLGEPAEEPVEEILKPTEEIEPIGTTNESFEVIIYDEEKAYNGTTLFPYAKTMQVFEINMEGEVIWEFTMPDEWVDSDNIMGFDAERLENGNVVMVVGGFGIYEIDSEGNLVWSHNDPDVSHDADRLENGNTLYVFGNNDGAPDAQVKEVNPEGELVWEWHARDHYKYADYKDFSLGGWTHTNAAQRLSDGTTLINMRNFFRTIIVDEAGEVIKEYDWADFGNKVDPHEGHIYEEEGFLLVCLQNGSPDEAVEVDLETGEVQWSYNHPSFRTSRDCDRLPNGNTLIVGVDNGGTANGVSMDDDYSMMIEVTVEGEIVWALKVVDEAVGNAPGWFYKAERLGL